MEFDIAELGIHNVGCRWSSTLLTYGWSMEFDIVDKSWRRANLLGRVLRGVRLNKTSYSWSREFDIVELETDAK